MLQVDRIRLERAGRAVLREVTFGVERGHRVALMGPSGTGKSTVLRAIAGLEPIEAGTIAVDGMAVVPGRPNRLVGLVFQFHHLFAHMSALTNVALAPVHVLGEPRAAAEDRARQLLEKLGVAHRADALPHELSGGEAQRVAIARALAMRPPLLLMDEPTAALDAARRADLAATVRQLAADGTTILVATHDEEFAALCVDRVLVLHEGGITDRGRSSSSPSVEP